MSLHLASSNRFERLLEVLRERIGTHDSASPFEPDCVIVPSMAVRRRIELTAADRHGVCANVEFRFLAEWLWEQIAKVVPGVDEASPFAPSPLAWRIHRILGEDGFAYAHPALARYVEQADELMRYDLAVRLADLYDRYITYRTDWLEAWAAHRRAEAGAPDAFVHEPWQAALWRRIIEELGAARQHPSVAFFKAITNGTIDARAAGLPRVAHVFCLPSIPPLYVDMLRELARWTSLHVYMLNPCEAYWMEIVAPRRLAELKARKRADYHETGNRLLAQWGAQTRGHLRVTLPRWEGAVHETAHYEPAGGDTLLASVQRSMLDLVEIEPGSQAPLRFDDGSIELHACHSLTRELEVLQDRLLALFAADASLEPSDILVVTPRLEDAAPLIDAVFGNVTDGRRIPFDITGRARSAQNGAARALLDVLALATSRFHASAVFELLQQPIVARRFGFDASALDAVRGWIGVSGIRWGLHGEHRASLDLPALARHSFADGFDRLFLGYAVAQTAQHAMGDALPAGNVEGGEAAHLGSFWRFVRLLENLREDCARPRAMTQWLHVVDRAVDALMLADDRDVDDLRELEATLREVGEDARRGGTHAMPIAIDVLRTALERALDNPARGGVPGGALTFASMTSLRNLPYRVICAIGLDDRAFPSLDRPLEFDLIAAAPRPGDRQRRDEDRNVFLDLLLSARERFYLSYTGRNIRDNATLPPSTVVSDLLDVLVPAIAADPRSEQALGTARARLIAQHPLQAFSAECFRPDGDPRLKSFNTEYCEALRNRLARATPVIVTAPTRDLDPHQEIAQDPTTAFFGTPLEVPREEWRTVSLERLRQFFRNPCRYLLKHRLGIDLPRAEDELQDDEPFVPDWTARDALAKRLLPLLLQGHSAQSLRHLAVVGVEYPAGTYGENLLDQELATLEIFAGHVRDQTSEPALDPISHAVELVVGSATWTLQGVIGDLRPAGLVRQRYDAVRAVDYLDGWIEHLFLNAIDVPVEKRTTWISRDGRYVLPPVPDARERLGELMSLYAEGLRIPLHFFPKSAWAYVTEGTLGAAQQKWLTLPSHLFPREDHDPSYRLCLRGVPDPLDAAFERSAHIVLDPLLRNILDPRIEKTPS